MDKKKMIKVKILPGRGIGGVGYSGDVVWMDEDEAAQYVRDGYVQPVMETDEATKTTKVVTTEVEDHKVMKPQSRRK